MTVLARQANFMLPGDLLNDLKQLVGQRQQSRFVAEAVRKELQREQTSVEELSNALQKEEMMIHKQEEDVKEEQPYRRAPDTRAMREPLVSES